MTYTLYLASTSPRRREYLQRLGLPFVAGVSPLDEEAAQQAFQGRPDDFALWTAEQKAQAVFTEPTEPGLIVIAADTTVLMEQEILGKPKDPDEAVLTLTRLGDRWHRVISGVAVAWLGDDGLVKMVSGKRETPVRMRPYTRAEITAYVATGDPLDKAGSYGIQHPSFQPTAAIQGCYLNVVGLPLCLLSDLLRQAGVSIPERDQGEKCPWSPLCILN